MYSHRGWFGRLLTFGYILKCVCVGGFTEIIVIKLSNIEDCYNFEDCQINKKSSRNLYFF